jgi:hypothetical protein
MSDHPSLDGLGELLWLLELDEVSTVAHVYSLCMRYIP